MEAAREAEYVVIGGGIIGIAIARALTLEGCSVLLVERNELLSGASGGNSGILHCGFDSTPGLLETQCVKEGHELMRRLLAHFELNVVNRTGAIVAAYTEEEAAQVKAIFDTTTKSHRTALLNRQEVLARVPGLKSNDSLRCGLFVPEEWVVDSWMCAIFLLSQAVAAGLQVLTGTPIVSCQRVGGWWRFNNGAIRARRVINCGGTHADVLEYLAHGSASVPFVSRPRKGQFALVRAPPSSIPHIIYPLPSAKTKGVLLYPSLAESVLVVGPTAEDQNHRDECQTTEVARKSLLDFVRLRIGSDLPFIGEYAGLRPATCAPNGVARRDYYIEGDASWVCVASIRSTGFTACLGIAQYVLRQFFQRGSSFHLGSFPKGFSTDPTLNQNGKVTICGQSLRVTHPLSKMRLQGLAAMSKL